MRSSTDSLADMGEPVTLPMIGADGQSREQFRISHVQVLNWGAYAGLQTMAVSRMGTAILGPSGRGKSTLLDAMASVVLPNPQEFNQAARDDYGRKRERTVYSYARGQTDQRQDENQRSATTNYLRPPGIQGFPSGTAITWETGGGQRATAFRLAWVSADTDGPEAINNATTYGFVNDFFDLATMNGITPVRAGSSPLSKSSLERLVDTSSGDIIDTSQARVHAKMRSVLGMGTTDDSQRRAMQLLRRAQASKGIFSINALFKEFVLTEPLAIARWELALRAYREASALYDEFESAKRRQQTLEPLPGLAEKFRAAGSDYVLKNRLLVPVGDSASARVDVWHAARIAEWAEKLIDANRLDRAEIDAELTAARTAAGVAERKEQEARDLLSAAGGDKSRLIQAKLDPAREDLARTERARQGFRDILATVNLELPRSPSEHSLLVAILEEQAELAVNQFRTADIAANEASGIHWNSKRKINELKSEIDQLKRRGTNIPDDAVQRRDRIARGTDVDPTNLPYAGELLRIKPSEMRWEKAIVGLLLPIASTLLVDERDFAVVRRFVYENDMQGSITLAPARTTTRAIEPTPGTVPTLLDIAPNHAFGTWLLRELIDTCNYWCVERENELENARPSGTRGAITPAGMRTGSRDRIVKDDRRVRYSWIGWDNADLLRKLDAEMEASRREERDANDRAEAATEQREAVRQRRAALTTLLRELSWEAIDLATLTVRVSDLEAQLEAANSPEVASLIAAEKAHRAAAVEAMAKVSNLEEKQQQLNTTWTDLVTAQDDANRIFDAEPPFTPDERAALQQIPFDVPPTVKDIHQSRRAAHQILREQVERHQHDRETYATAIVGRLAAYRNLDSRTARETDGTIDSLVSVLAIYDQLVRDDLPRMKSAWLAKVDEELNDQLRKLLVQIEDDSRTIRRGLNPINTVLQNVRFREESTLLIEAVEHVSSDLRDFRSVVTKYTANSIGLDIVRDEEEVEKSFATLRRQLERLDDLSRAGDAWRRRVFDAREHVEFRAIESRSDGAKIIHEGVSGMSGGEGQELIAFILGAALRFRLGEGKDGPPRYGSVILDEGFVKADSDYTGRALAALRALGFQLIVGAPREKATAFEGHVETVAYINSDPSRPQHVRIFPMTIREALQLSDDEGC